MLTGKDRSRSRTLVAEDRSRPRSPGGRQIAMPPAQMVSGVSSSDLKDSLATLEQMASLIEHLGRTFKLDVKDAGSIGAGHRVERHEVAGYWRASASAEQLGEHDIANLLQEALEEGAADRKLTQIVVALGLALGSLASPPSK